MKRYINVGAYINNQRAKTKKALKEALTNNPASVIFDVTSVFHGGPNTYITNDVTEDIALNVVGPDPYTNRRWYATVTRNKDGEIKLT